MCRRSKWDLGCQGPEAGETSDTSPGGLPPVKEPHQLFYRLSLTAVAEVMLCFPGGPLMDELPQRHKMSRPTSSLCFGWCYREQKGSQYSNVGQTFNVRNAVSLTAVNMTVFWQMQLFNSLRPIGMINRNLFLAYLLKRYSCPSAESLAVFWPLQGLGNHSNERSYNTGGMLAIVNTKPSSFWLLLQEKVTVSKSPITSSWTCSFSGATFICSDSGAKWFWLE